MKLSTIAIAAAVLSYPCVAMPLEAKPLTLRDVFKQEADAAKVPAKLLSAICWVETRHNFKAIKVNDGGSPSFGICQVKKKTARFVGVDNISSVRGNIKAAARYLSFQKKRYGHWDKAVVAYNRGHYKKPTSYLIKVKLAMREKNGQR